MTENKDIVIKKYPNRRLYNTETSSYVTLEDLSNAIRSNRNIIVIDTKTGEDLTRITLIQIILEHETKGYNLLPTELLKYIIKFHNSEAAAVFHTYLSQVMQYFAANQDGIEKMFSGLVGKEFGMTNSWTKAWEDYTKKSTDFIQSVLESMPGPERPSDKK